MADLQPARREHDLARSIAAVWQERFRHPYRPLFDAILTEARHLVGASAAVLNATVDGVTLVAIAVSGDADELLREQLEVQSSNSGAVLETGAPMNLPQAWQDRRTWHPAASPERIGPTMIARLATYPIWGAVVAVYNSPGTPDWTAEQVAVLNTFCDAVGVVTRPLHQSIRAATIDVAPVIAKDHTTSVRADLGRLLARDALRAALTQPDVKNPRLALEIATDEAIRDALKHPDDAQMLHALLDTFWSFARIAEPALSLTLGLDANGIANLVLESLEDAEASETLIT